MRAKELDEALFLSLAHRFGLLHYEFTQDALNYIPAKRRDFR